VENVVDMGLDDVEDYEEKGFVVEWEVKGRSLWGFGGLLDIGPAV
jgi:hypothetical protein